MKQVAVIGGGVAGMTAAITAASKGAGVTIYERNDRVGKKILSTGNGRCNFTNLCQQPECYRSDHPEFAWEVIRRFDEKKLIAFFLQLGIYSKNRNGYLYPNSDQASSVLDAFRMECKRLGIHIVCDAKCLEIHPLKKGVRIRTEQGVSRADSVILATGSKAAPATGSDGYGYTLAKNLGHHLVPVLPALVQLRCREDFYKAVSGVRIQAEVSLYAEDLCIAKDVGEVQLTNYGISGIPVFQVSRFAARALYEKKQVRAILNFMPDFTEDTCIQFLQQRINTRPDKTLEEFFIGLFHKKLADLWIRLSQIKRDRKVRTLSEAEVQKLVSLIREFETIVEATNSYEQAQVCCGGVDTKEVHPETMESLYHPNVYFAGEILDVDGMCGGYNIQFAVSSGVAAGNAAAKGNRLGKETVCLESTR